MGLFSSEVDYFGLDIGSTAVRLVWSRKGTHPSLVTYGETPVPVGVATSDSDADQMQMAQIIRDLVKKTKVGTKNVVAGLPGDKLFASLITTPKLNHQDLAKAIKYQAEQYIPMPLDQVRLDWSLVDETADGKSQEVLLVAAPILTTNKYLNILEQAGLDVIALEANMIAMARAVMPPGSDLPVLLLDCGDNTTDLAIVYRGAPMLIRSLPVGTKVIVRSIAHDLGLDETQAEQFAFKFGLTQTKLEGQVYKSIKPGFDQLLSEVDKSIKFFTTRFQNAKLEKIIITGGMIALPELPTHLATAAGLPVEIGNSWLNVAYPASMQSELMNQSFKYAVAAGLSLRNYR